jgi:hypothetical protein
MNVHAIALLGAKKFRPSCGYPYLHFLFENINTLLMALLLEKFLTTADSLTFLLRPILDIRAP